MLEPAALPGFWGAATATVDWCESNYERSYYVCELFKTVSSLAMVLAGVLGIALHRRVLDLRRGLRFFALRCRRDHSASERGVGSPRGKRNMTYREFPPHRALQPFVDRFWVSVAEASAGPRRILPDGCIDLMVDLTHAAPAVAVGTMTRAIVFHPRAPVRTVAARFKPGGAVPFLRLPADELTDRVAGAIDIGVRWLTPAFLGEFTDLGDAVRSLERCLLVRLSSTPTPDPLIAHAVSRLFGATPPSVAALARESGWSRQHLSRAFRGQVGVSPKHLARVARLQRAIADLQRGPSADLAGAALRCGYFDQAHMTNDFRDLAGVTPVVARSSASSIFPIPSLFAAP